MIAAYFACVLLYYSVLRDWKVIDALYFAVVTMATVGYGDIHPQGLTERLSTCLFTLIAVGMIATAVGLLISGIMDDREAAERDKSPVEWVFIRGAVRPAARASAGGVGGGRADGAEVGLEWQSETVGPPWPGAVDRGRAPGAGGTNTIRRNGHDHRDEDGHDRSPGHHRHDHRHHRHHRHRHRPLCTASPPTASHHRHLHEHHHHHWRRRCPRPRPRHPPLPPPPPQPSTRQQHEPQAATSQRHRSPRLLWAAVGKPHRTAGGARPVFVFESRAAGLLRAVHSLLRGSWCPEEFSQPRIMCDMARIWSNKLLNCWHS